MAKYKGTIKLKGTIGDVVYYTLNGKQIARRKAEGIGELIKTSENYAVTRKNNSQFRVATHMASGLYRMAKLAGYTLDYPQQNQMIKKAVAIMQKNKDLDVYEKAHYSQMFSGTRLLGNAKTEWMSIKTAPDGRLIKRHTKEQLRLTLIFGQYWPVVRTENLYSSQLDMERVAMVEYDFEPTTTDFELIHFDSLLPEMDFDWDVCVMATAPFDSEGRVWETKAGVWVV
jgi:hypothetical protein